MNLFDLAAKITVDTSEYEKGIKSAKKSMEEYKRDVMKLSKVFEKEGMDRSSAMKKAYKEIDKSQYETSKNSKKHSKTFFENWENAAKGIGNVSKKIGSALLSISKVGAAAIGGLSAIGLTYNSQMEEYTTNFEVMLGSAEKSVKKVEELKKMAAATPFGMAELSEATQTLLAFQVPAEKSGEILRMLGDVALGDKEKLKGLALVFGQVSSAGKLQGQDLMQLINQGFNPLNYIAKRTGESMEELRDRMSKGGISASEVEQAFKDATSAGGQFYQGMEKASKTTKGLISTLADDSKALVGEVIEPISKSLTETLLPNAIESVGQLTQSFRTYGIDGLIQASGEIISSALTVFTQNLPNFVARGFQIAESLVSGISQNLATISDSAVVTVAAFLNGLSGMLPELVKSGVNMVIQLANSVVSNLDSIINAGLEMLVGLAKGFSDAYPNIISQIPVLIGKLVGEIITNLPQIVSSGVEIIINLLAGFVKAMPELILQIPILMAQIVDAVLSVDWLQLGRDMIGSIKDGILNAWDGLVNWFNNLWDGLFGRRNVDVNVNASSSGVNGSHKNGLDYVPFDGYIAELHKGERVLTAKESESLNNGFGGTVFSGVTINISGANYKDEESLAESIAEKLQTMAERKAAQYA